MPDPVSIESIGYGGGSEIPVGKGGARILAKGRVWEAPRLYTSGHGPEAILIGVDGKVLHRWHCDWNTLVGVPALDGPTQNTFRRAHLLPQGDLLVVYGGRGLVRMDANGKPRWVYSQRAHHDLTLDGQGRLWTLIRQERVDTRLGHGAPVVDDLIVEVDLATGAEISRVSVMDSLLNSPAARFLREAKVTKGDFMHTNTIEILDSEAASVHPSWKAGQVLICLRELDALAVIDLQRTKAIWFRSEVGSAPHEPRLTDSGSLLLFDNHGNQGASAVREYELPGFAEIWNHKGQPPDQFFSRFCGAAHRLGNGNTLIVESTRGMAFELDPDGHRVWEFENPERAGEDGRWIAAIFDLVPIDRTGPSLDWLER